MEKLFTTGLVERKVLVPLRPLRKRGIVSIAMLIVRWFFSKKNFSKSLK
jgi:hypothetical protein